MTTDHDGNSAAVTTRGPADTSCTLIISDSGSINVIGGAWLDDGGYAVSGSYGYLGRHPLPDDIAPSALVQGF